MVLVEVRDKERDKDGETEIESERHKLLEFYQFIQMSCATISGAWNAVVEQKTESPVKETLEENSI